jgi:hypothetical protein
MGTLATELGRYAETHAAAPRIYADANVPAGAVAFMRARLGWDVFYVAEHDELRRARDSAHYALARRLRRTLVTLDRDFFDDRRFPPAEGAGVIVCAAPDARGLERLLAAIDRAVFRAAAPAVLPLAGRKEFWHPGRTHPRAPRGKRGRP